MKVNLRCNVRQYDGSNWDSREVSIPLSEIRSLTRTESALSHPETWFLLEKTDSSSFYVDGEFVTEETPE